MKRPLSLVAFAGALLLVAANSPAQPQDRGPEESWRAGPPPAGVRERMRERRQEGPPPMEELPMIPGMEGMPEAERPVRAFLQKIARARAEVVRHNRTAEEIERAQERLDDPEERERLGKDSVKRTTRILELRRELLALEKEEFTARARREIGEAEAKLEGFRAENAAAQESPMVERLAERLTRLNEASKKGYEELSEALVSESPWESKGRTERLEREVEALRKRLEKLQADLPERSGAPQGAEERKKEGFIEMQERPLLKKKDASRKESGEKESMQ